MHESNRRPARWPYRRELRRRAPIQQPGLPSRGSCILLSQAQAQDYISTAVAANPALRARCTSSHDSRSQHESTPPPRSPTLKTSGHLCFPPVVAEGMANAITAPPVTGVRSTIHVKVDVTGKPVNGGARSCNPQRKTSHSTARATSLASTRALCSAPNRVPAYPTSSRTTWQPSISTTKTSLALHTGARRGPATSPWIALIVLSNPSTSRAKHRQPASTFHRLQRRDVLPTPYESWAWAHVHFNQGLSPKPSTELVSTDMNAVIPRVQSILDSQPRPRLFAAAVPPHSRCQYHLRRVRNSCIRERPAGRPRARPDQGPFSPGSAWATYANQPEPLNFPYYYRWQFTTGDRGDFRYLVTLLKPRPSIPPSVRATSMCRTPARIFRVSTSRTSTAFCAWAERSRCPKRILACRQTERDAYRTGTPPIPMTFKKPWQSSSICPTTMRLKRRRCQRSQGDRAEHAGISQPIDPPSARIPTR